MFSSIELDDNAIGDHNRTSIAEIGFSNIENEYHVLFFIFSIHIFGRSFVNIFINPLSFKPVGG